MGHFGSSGIKRQIRNHFDFQHLDTLVNNEVATCEDCQLFTRKAVKGPLVPVFVPSRAWEYISIDFFGPMPDGSHVLVVQDLCTKYPVALLMKRGTTAKQFQSSSRFSPILLKISTEYYISVFKLTRNRTEIPHFYWCNTSSFTLEKRQMFSPSV